MSLFKSAPVLALLAAIPAEGIKMPRLRGGDTALVAMHMYRDDCGLASGFSFVQNPGAGMDPAAIKPFKNVLKDGFYAVDCVKDYMFEHGDKFGDNKASYKLGDLANVSIVHYTSHVPKEDREEMTHEVCFRFCRTVPEMSFFGITNGRECYCTPYYQAEASDSSDCDEVCDGNKGAMCGGKVKSSVFGMHQCANTKADMTTAIASMDELSTTLAERITLISSTSDFMQSAASTFQDAFGKAGDPGASDLLQAAKVDAGKIAELVKRGTALQATAEAVHTAAEGLKGGDFTTSAVTVKAEEQTEAAEKTSADLGAMIKEIEQAFAANDKVIQIAQAEKGASKQYFSAMYFVNKTFEAKPSTCTGAASEGTMVATLDGCATACNNDLHECVGFQFFPPNTVPQGQLEGAGLCFLFSKLKSIRYYTGCVEQDGHADVKCYAKLSKFESTTIAPNPSGKCEACLKEAKQADRCFV